MGDASMYFLIGLSSVCAVSIGFITRLFPESAASFISKNPIAHRGLYNHEKGVPENSLAAFKAAIEKNYAIELDVMLTKDGQVVVYHDHDLNRLSHVDKRVEDLTLVAVQKIALLQSKEVPPSLTEVLDLVKGIVPLYIEIKHERLEPAGALEEKVEALLKEYPGDVALLSFNPESLEWFAKNAPHYQRGLNYEPERDEVNRPLRILERILRNSWISRPHFLVYDYDQMPSFLLSGLSFLRVLVPFTIKTQAAYEDARVHGHNVIFEKVDL
jgi:glycerophosphoryl diester phosphodiesterase